MQTREVQAMTKEELEEEIRLLREKRKKGYTLAPKVKRKNKKEPAMDIPDDLAKQLLALLAEGD